MQISFCYKISYISDSHYSGTICSLFLKCFKTICSLFLWSPKEKPNRKKKGRSCICYDAVIWSWGAWICLRGVRKRAIMVFPFRQVSSKYQYSRPTKMLAISWLLLTINRRMMTFKRQDYPNARQTRCLSKAHFSFFFCKKKKDIGFCNIILLRSGGNSTV